MAIAQADVNRQHQEAPARGIHIIWGTAAKPSATLQQHIKELASQLDSQTRIRELVRLQVTTQPGRALESTTAEIGVRLHQGADDAAEHVMLDLLFHSDSGLNREIARNLPLGEFRSRLLRLLRVYMVEGCGKDTFATWSRGMSDQELRSRLGLSEQTVVAG